MNRLYLNLALAVAVVLLLWFGYKAVYNNGVQAERAVWVAAQAEADRKDRAKEQGDTRTSETIADTTRVEAAQQASATDTATAASVETIRYEYRTLPAHGCIPAPRPARVQAELDQAVDALSAAAR